MFYNIPAPPAIVINHDMGGVLADYALQAGQWKAEQRTIAITGTCASACTLYLGARHACVSATTKIMFHAPYDWHNGRAVPWAREMMMRAYPMPLRRWIRQHGGLTADVLTLEGRELTGIFRTCSTAVASAPTFNWF